jgi:hypothetical protein
VIHALLARRQFQPAGCRNAMTALPQIMRETRTLILKWSPEQSKRKLLAMAQLCNRSNH